MKKGFTLIELLAVITILGVILLITIPLYNRIIEESKDSSRKKSVTNYIRAVETNILSNEVDLDSELISDGTYQIMEDGSICVGIMTSTECSGNKLEIDLDGKIPTSGKVRIEKRKVTLATNLFFEKFYASVDEYDEIKVTSEKQNDPSIVCTAVTKSVAGNVPKGKFLPGDEYLCEVKKGVKYNFFVLSTEGDKVNLIMDSNINADGEPIKEENPSKRGNISWITSADYNIANTDNTPCDKSACTDEGPITIINYLAKATKTWDKEGLIGNETYTDENGRYGTIAVKGKARLPKKSEVWSYQNSFWLLNYLAKCDYYAPEGKTNVKNVFGYWTQTTAENSASDAYFMYYCTSCYNNYPVGESYQNGVRPVITVSRLAISN